ncbi:hypothetical protein GH714_034427 [Hevea brasiliensis]|uniref:Bicarbonate transporter-like transmembrane domain-containing protein n=1 Tax=Hevea brasiliensis TaxID=3981 RepID=A0A6A6NE06_HEVBR|nr:hypothetical protein GH714_034427 [Hevea brasiliensis]
MEHVRTPFRGIINDFRGRAACYKQDWIGGVRSGLGILAPTTYIFFASALPVIAFGEQLNRDTDGSLSTVETLASTALCGIIHSILGGQPLLILGVAEPTVIMYTYLYNFAKGKEDLGQKLFLAWAGWVCVWTALLLLLLAIFNACTVINRFTRIAGELFGMLITVLFIQEAIKGMVSEFNIPKAEDPKLEKYQFPWLYTNGLLGIIFTFGLLYTALKSRKARSWWYGTGWFRSFIADYGVPLMVVIWTALSFSVPSKVPSGVPRRLFSPLPWESASLHHWTVIKTLLCGLLGLPPSNGVLPQSPMHTKSLAVLKRQLIRRKMVESAKESIKQKASNSEIYGKMQAVFLEIDSSPAITVAKELKDLKEAVMNGDEQTREKIQRIRLILRSTLMPTYLSELMSKEVFEGVHASFVESVPFKYIAMFTIFQLVYFLVCFGVTWIPIAGILFPLPFFILISIRQRILPKLFNPHHLRELDAAEYEEITSAPRRSLSLSFKEKEAAGLGNEEGEVEVCDAEMLDELTTNRGEFKVRTVSFHEDNRGQVYPEAIVQQE